MAHDSLFTCGLAPRIGISLPSGKGEQMPLYQSSGSGKNELKGGQRSPLGFASRLVAWIVISDLG
jgi:hypothetical protein